MLKLLTAFSLFFLGFNCFSQPYYGQIVTNKKDTINVHISVSDDNLLDNELIAEIQRKIVIVNQGAVSGTYTAKDLRSFRIKIGTKNYTFDSIDGLYFAERLYVGKVRLYKYLKSVINSVGGYAHEGLVRDYMVLKPGRDQWQQMFANGLSRLITKDVLASVFGDCPETFSKIEQDVIKIKNEDKLVEFVKEYENNCSSKW